MKKISIIGLGYVGLPTFLVLSSIKKSGRYSYEIEGIEKNNYKGKKIKENFKKGKKWIEVGDKSYNKLFDQALKRKDVYINNNYDNLSDSNIIIVSVNFDFNEKKRSPFKNLIELTQNIAKKIKKNSLLIFETTLPPGTTNKIILPTFHKFLKKRKMKLNDIFFCYSYERVMPGKEYINSIRSNHRCYSGINKQSKLKCKSFFKSFVNYKKYQLTEFNKIIECETAKILENSYRATNIALIDEWTQVSKIMKIDLKKIIQTVKLRTTHSNMMWPGLGVGGYCLTKDPGFIKFSTRKFFRKKINFPIIKKSTSINKNMYKTSIQFVIENVKNLKRKKVLICGISYREDTNDLRYSPAIDFLNSIKSKSARVSIYDPFYKRVDNKKNFEFVDNFKNNYDIVIFCVAHDKFKKISFSSLRNKIVFDLNRVLTNNQKYVLQKKGNSLFDLGVN